MLLPEFGGPRFHAILTSLEVVDLLEGSPQVIECNALSHGLGQSRYVGGEQL